MTKQDLYERVKNDLAYHAAGDKGAELNAVRNAAHEFAVRLIDLVPEGRELSSALTKIEEAMFHANAGISRTQPLA